MDGHAGGAQARGTGAGVTLTQPGYEQRNRSIAEHCRLCYQNLRRFLLALVSRQF